MEKLKQLFAAFGVNLRLSMLMPRQILSVVVGFAAVVFVLVSLLSISTGLAHTMAVTGSSSVALIKKKIAGAPGTPLSDVVQSLASLPGVAHVDGKALVSPEFVTTIKIPKRKVAVKGAIIVRGVLPIAFRVHQRVEIVQGRQFKQASNELIAGLQAAREYRWLIPGAFQKFANLSWKVVGEFKTNGSFRESEIWTDLHTLQSAYNANKQLSVIAVRLTSTAMFSEFKRAVTTDPRFQTDTVVREDRYYANKASVITFFISLMGWAIAILLGVGISVGTLTIMATAFVRRRTELGTLRAFGFERAPLLVALLAETLLFGVFGGIIGGIGAWAAFNGYQAATSNGEYQIAFQFAVTAKLIMTGVGYALILGFAGGLIPAWQASRLKIVRAMRAV